MSWLPVSILKDRKTQSVGASETNTVVSNVAGLTDGGAQTFRVDIFVGTVTVTNDVVLKLQSSTGYGIWNDGPSDNTITTKTGAAFTAATTDILTDASHGLAQDAAVVVANSGGALPGGLEAGKVYYVDVIDTNTFYLANKPGGAQEDRVDITSAGTGTNSYYAVSQISIAIENTNSTDQTYTPMEHALRVVATSGVSDAISILDVLLTQAR